MTRTVVIREGDAAEEVGRVTWDGETVTIEGAPMFKADVEQGVQDGDATLTPADGEDFLDAVLQEYGGNGYIWAEEE